MNQIHVSKVPVVLGIYSSPPVPAFQVRSSLGPVLCFCILSHWSRVPFSPANDLFLCLLQRSTFSCDHKRSAADKHPYCEPCAQNLGWELCTPTHTCPWCNSTSKDDWKIVLSARRKRAFRIRLKLSPGKSPAKSASAAATPRRTSPRKSLLRRQL